jgi:hypothetical protein
MQNLIRNSPLILTSTLIQPALAAEVIKVQG